LDIRVITDRFSASPQIAPSDAYALAEAGYACVINNRPDGEAPGQPSSADIEDAVRAAGLSYTHIPVSGMNMGHDRIEAMAEVWSQTSGPVLAYCRSGTRSIVLWALACAPDHEPDWIIKAAARGGYDLSGLRTRLAERHNQARSV